MTQPEFTAQFDRLISTYGKRAFPAERTDLIWAQVRDLDAVWFVKLCDHMIGSMRQPPMVPDFREAVYKQRQATFNRDTEQAASVWAGGDFHGLKAYLESIGAVSLNNAVEEERWRIRPAEKENKGET